MYRDELLSNIKQLTEPYINRRNYEIVDLTLFRSKEDLRLRFLVDKPKGGIAIWECAVLNEGLNRFLAEADIIREDYSLEVSSPGVDRPLETEKDFLRVSQRAVKVFLNESMKGKTEIEGIVDDVQNNCLILRVGIAQSNVPIKIPLTQIKKAKQVINGY